MFSLSQAGATPATACKQSALAPADTMNRRVKTKFPRQRAGRTPPPGGPVPLGTGGRAVVPYSPQTAALCKKPYDFTKGRSLRGT